MGAVAPIPPLIEEEDSGLCPEPRWGNKFPQTPLGSSVTLCF
jgi:hypothetical protein